MNIGKTLQKYRLQLGITQKEMAEGILSPSYYSKVERNEHKISAEDLFAILIKHSIDFSEFSKSLHQTTSDDSQIFQDLDSEQTIYFYERNFEALKKMPEKIQNIETLSSFNRQLLLAMNELSLYGVTQEAHYLTEENTAFMKNQFFEAENWDSFKLSLYTNIMGIYEFDSNHAIISSLLSKKIEEQPAKHQSTILYILINFISDCLLNDSLLLAKHYNQLVIKTPVNYDNALQKILAQYYEYLFTFIEESNQENEEKALDFIKVFQEINFGVYEQAVDLLENLKELY